MMGYAEDKEQREKEKLAANLQKVKNGETLFNFRGEERTEEMCEIAFKRDIDEYKYIPDNFKTLEMTTKFIRDKISSRKSLFGMAFPLEHLLENDKEILIELLSNEPDMMWSLKIFPKEFYDDLELVITIYLRAKQALKKSFIETYNKITKDKNTVIFSIPEIVLVKMVKSGITDRKIEAMIKLYKD
jgi:hypothetical protein